MPLDSTVRQDGFCTYPGEGQGRKYLKRLSVFAMCVCHACLHSSLLFLSPNPRLSLFDVFVRSCVCMCISMRISMFACALTRAFERAPDHLLVQASARPLPSRVSGSNSSLSGVLKCIPPLSLVTNAQVETNSLYTNAFSSSSPNGMFS